LLDANSGRRNVQEFENDTRKTGAVWKQKKKHIDTSGRYSMPRPNMDLWSRIHRNSSGTLPRQIDSLGSEQIKSQDRNTVESYVTSSRGIRKCCLTVLVACAKSAAYSIGCFEGLKKRSYRIRPISLSVKELSKSTAAGADTYGKKNDKNVQNRVIAQINDLFNNPTLRKAIGLNPEIHIDDSIGERLYLLPETIFHRFQAMFDEDKLVCNVKSRIVWCVPYLIVALENMFFGDILQSVKEAMLKKNVCIYPIGLRNYEIGQNCIGTLRNTYSIVGNKTGFRIYSLDFSKFDINIPQFVKDIFFALLGAVIDFESVNFADKIYYYLRVYVKYTPFIYDGAIWFKQRGISSGLFITNLFDTFWNLTLHIFTNVIDELYPDVKQQVLVREGTFDKIFMDKNYINTIEQNGYVPFVRVMGDDSIILCREETFILFRAVCRAFGMTVTIKHVCKSPDDPIFFLGRYWDRNNLPYQTEGYIALHIVYTRWYEKKVLPFHLRDLHLNRMLSICLPLKGGKEFLDKYLFDYEPYSDFLKSEKGFTYMKDFIENTFQYISREKAFVVQNY